MDSNDRIKEKGKIVPSRYMQSSKSSIIHTKTLQSPPTTLLQSIHSKRHSTASITHSIKSLSLTRKSTIASIQSNSHVIPKPEHPIQSKNIAIKSPLEELPNIQPSNSLYKIVSEPSIKLAPIITPKKKKELTRSMSPEIEVLQIRFLQFKYLLCRSTLAFESRKLQHEQINKTLFDQVEASKRQLEVDIEAFEKRKSDDIENIILTHDVIQHKILSNQPHFIIFLDGTV